MRRALLLILKMSAVLVSCRPSAEGGACREDSDCAGDQSCLYDVDLATTYCTSTCIDDRQCSADRTCRVASDGVESGATQLRLCVSRVRACSDAELCNGLDDDCDGVIDGPACAPISGCLDDGPCGAFSCQAPAGARATMCLAPRAEAHRGEGDACTAGVECPNGECSTGQCRSLCRPADASACRGEDYCARAVGLRSEPLHNVCQALCASASGCAEGQACVWRDIYYGPGSPQNGVSHVFVCAKPAPERKALGEACSANTAAGDDECAHGLCFGFVCTRRCEGRGSDCGDVGADFECRTTTLRYGVQEFAGNICVRRGA